jgi:hypothetical protein
MAEEIVGVKIQVDATDMNKSVGDLRKKIVETEAEVKRLQEAYGEQSKEAIEGQKRLAQLQDITNKKIDQQNQRIDDAAKTVSALSAAYGGVQGALELTGLAGEDTIKQLAKIQSALAIGDAVQNLAEFRGAITNTFKSFGTSIKSTFSTLKSSLIATGIGAFVVALGLVAANFETVKKVVLNLIPGLGSVADFIGNLVNKVTDFIGITSEAGRATEKLIKDNEKAIKEGERNLELNGDKYDEFTQRKIKANIEFLKKQNEFKKDEQLSEEQKNIFIRQAREKANREIAKSDEDRTKAALESAKKLSEQQKALVEKQEQERKKREEDAKKAREKELDKIIAGRLEQDELLKDIDDRRKESIKSIDPIIATQANLQIKTIGDRVTAESEAQIKIDNLRKEDAKNVEIYEKSKVDAYAQTANALGALGQIVGQETATGKALSAAQALINTYLGITQIWANKTTIPEPFGTIQKIASTVTAAASGFTAVKNIGKVKVPGFGGGGVSTPSLSSITAPVGIQQPQAQLTQLNQESINQMGSAAGRAYVVESDITNQQEKIIRINRAARLG